MAKKAAKRTGTKNRSRSDDAVARLAEKPQAKPRKLRGRAAKEKEQERRFRIAQKFAARLIEKFKRTVKSVVVYGSTAKGTAKKESDIDIFVILDDTRIEKEVPPDIKDRIWNELLNIAKDVDERITIQAFMFLTEFWESLRVAEPVTLAILRWGIPIFDVGVYMPAKRMLQRGQIPTTKEAVDKKITAAPQFVEYAESRVKSAAHYMEQAMASAGNAALMFIGRMPQNKEDVPKELEEYFVKEKLLEQKFVDDARAIIKFAKDIEHAKEIENIGTETDRHLKLTQEFVRRMNTLLKELEIRKKTSVLMRTYKTFLRANVGALRYVGVTPPEELKDLPKIMYQNFPELKEMHSDLFEGLAKALTTIKEGKGEHVPEREIYALREKTKTFVIALGQKLKELQAAGKIKAPEAGKTATQPDIMPEDHAVEALGVGEEGEEETGAPAGAAGAADANVAGADLEDPEEKPKAKNSDKKQ